MDCIVSYVCDILVSLSKMDTLGGFILMTDVIMKSDDGGGGVGCGDGCGGCVCIDILI
jgi:hypothetical protein